MRVILDECLPKRLTRELPGHDAVTVPLAGWAGIQNGDLLRRISGNFEAFITIDGNLAHQQNTGKLSFGVVVLGAPSNKIEDIRPLIPEILQSLQALKPGQVIRVS
jgi:hypothetical protein